MYSSRTYQVIEHNFSHVTSGHAQWAFSLQRSSAEELSTQKKSLFSKFLLNLKK